MERERPRESERNPESWTYVSSRKRRGSRRNQGKTGNIGTTTTNSDGITTCYINNLPEDIVEKEVERTFERWGNVVDVYIAKKRNKAGRIFGFVRYAAVKDERWLEEQLRDIWFGSYKVWVNISRYRRPQEKEFNRFHSAKEKQQSHRKREIVNRQAQPAHHDLGRQSVRTQGKTYAAATQNIGVRRNGQANKQGEANQGEKQRSQKECQERGDKEGGGMQITINEDEMEWAKRGFVGFVRNIEEIHMIQQRLEGEGINSVSVIPMGGDRVFMKVDEKEDMRMLVKDSEQVFQQLFSIVREWEPRDVGGSRYVWVRVLGIPVHAWRRRVFSQIIISLGSLIKMDQVTEDMERLDMARLFIKTSSMEFINKVIRIKINKENFIIRITEEICECSCMSKLLELVESPEEEEEDEESVNSDDTHIPESVASEEDEETMEKIKNNYENLILEADKEATLNEVAEEQIQNQIEKREEAREERGIEETSRDSRLTLNETGERISDEREKIDTSSLKEGDNYDEVGKNSGDELSKKDNDNNEKENELALESSPSNHMEAQQNSNRSPTRHLEENETGPEKIETNHQRSIPSTTQDGEDRIVTDGENNEISLERSKARSPSNQSGGENKNEDSSNKGTKILRTDTEEQAQSPKDRRKRRVEILREKKKAMKKGKKTLPNCSCRHRRNKKYEKGKVEILVTENETEKKNWVLVHRGAKEVARDVWDIGKEFGLVHKGEEGEILQELIAEVKGAGKDLQ